MASDSMDAGNLRAFFVREFISSIGLSIEVYESSSISIPNHRLLPLINLQNAINTALVNMALVRPGITLPEGTAREDAKRVVDAARHFHATYAHPTMFDEAACSLQAIQEALKRCFEQITVLAVDNFMASGTSPKLKIER